MTLTSHGLEHRALSACGLTACNGAFIRQCESTRAVNTNEAREWQRSKEDVHRNTETKTTSLSIRKPVEYGHLSIADSSRGTK